MSTVRYSRLPSQGLVYGLDAVAFSGVFFAALLIGLAVIRDGIIGLVTSAPLAGSVAFLSMKKVHGQSLLTHVGREIGGMLRKMVGATSFRARPEKKKLTAKTSLDLPGREGRLHVYETGRGASVVWDAVRQTATITCVIATPGLGQPQVDSPTTLGDEERAWAIHEWSKVLGSFTQKPHVVRVTELETTRPGTISAEKRYFDEREQTGTPANASYREALERARESVVLHRTQLAITFSMSGEAKNLVKGYGGGVQGMLQLAALEMATTEEALYHAGFTRVAWLSAREWGAWGRSLIDPASQTAIDVRGGTQWEGVDPHMATPMVIDEHRNYVESDSGWHRTYWIQEWPRYETHPGFMSRLVFAKQQDGAPVRHTFMIVAAPVQAGEAMKRLDDEKRTWITNAGIRQKSGKPESQADIADWEAIQQHEADLVAGQGELRFSAFLTVTATNKDDLEREAASILNACSAAGIEPRLIAWQQAEALMNVAYPCGEGMK